MAAQDHGAIDLPPPGTTDFFPALLSRIQTASPSLPTDIVVLQSILLCLIAGDKHLIFRTPEEDIGLVAKLAASTLTSVFSYLTHKIKIRPLSDQPHSKSPEPFLRSLFLYSFTSASSTFDPDGSSSRSHKHRRRSLRTSSSSWKTKSKLGKTSSFNRSSSSPSLFNALPQAVSSDAFDPRPATSASSPTLASPPLGQKYTRAESMPPAPPRIHIETTFQIDVDSNAESVPLPAPNVLTLPRALVISGLEHTSRVVQGALVQVLNKSRIVLEGEDRGEDDKCVRGRELGKWEEENKGPRDGVWNLPEGFIIVYVCPLDPWERPKIHKSLLDKFAMSAPVLLEPPTRLSIRSTLSRHSPAVTPNPFVSNRQEILPPTLLPTLRGLHGQTHTRPVLFLYASDLFSATRHHPQLDGTLLTARATKDLEAIARAERVIGNDLTGMEIVKELAAMRGVKATDVLDVSEADIGRIFPRIVSHRLRVRDGPEDEILGSVGFSAVRGDAGDERERWERKTIREILIRILAVV